MSLLSVKRRRCHREYFLFVAISLRTKPRYFDRKSRSKNKASSKSLKENVDDEGVHEVNNHDSAMAKPAKPKLSVKPNKFPRPRTPPPLPKTELCLTSRVKVLDSDDDPIDMLS
jgi:hypothetical protein